MNEYEVDRGDSFKTSKTRTKTLEHTEASSIKYDLVGKIAEGTTLTRRTTVAILQGLRQDILLEQMVFPVTTVKTRGISRFPSFHPKFWLIRYIDEKGTPLYRVKKERKYMMLVCVNLHYIKPLKTA